MASTSNSCAEKQLLPKALVKLFRGKAKAEGVGFGMKVVEFQRESDDLTGQKDLPFQKGTICLCQQKAQHRPLAECLGKEVGLGEDAESSERGGVRWNCGSVGV